MIILKDIVMLQLNDKLKRSVDPRNIIQKM